MVSYVKGNTLIKLILIDKLKYLSKDILTCIHNFALKRVKTTGQVKVKN